MLPCTLYVKRGLQRATACLNTVCSTSYETLNERGLRCAVHHGLDREYSPCLFGQSVSFWRTRPTQRGADAASRRGAAARRTAAFDGSTGPVGRLGEASRRAPRGTWKRPGRASRALRHAGSRSPPPGSRTSASTPPNAAAPRQIPGGRLRVRIVTWQWAWWTPSTYQARRGCSGRRWSARARGTRR
jgi:hypothetical protein